MRQEAERRLREPFWAFVPLRNSQADFVRSTWNGDYGVFVLLGGNRSGKSESGAFVLTHLCIDVIPQRMAANGDKRATVWVVSKSYEDSGEIAWKQKLSRFIHPRNIASIVWRKRAAEWPALVILKNGVEIHFKAWEQDRNAFQGVAVYAVWADEQCPRDVFGEIQARCVDRSAPILYTNTPIDPDVFLDERYSNPPDGWRFYHIDIEDNRKSRGGYHDDAAVDAFLSEIKDTDLYETRKRGALLGLEGAVYKAYRRELHAMDSEKVDRILKSQSARGWTRAWGIDFGINNPFCCLWGAKDGDGRWWIYDEHYEAQRTIESHCDLINARNLFWAIPGDNLESTIVPSGNYYADTGDQMATGTNGYRVSGRRAMSEAGFTVVSASKDVYRGIESVQRALRVPTALSPDGSHKPTGDPPMLVISTRCRNLLKQMATYRWARPTSDVRSAPEQVVKVEDHACFVAGTMILTPEGERPIETITDRDYVQTAIGPRMVLATHCIGAQPIIELYTNKGRVLQGTPDHLIWTIDRGYVRMDHLLKSDRLLTHKKNPEGCRVFISMEVPIGKSAVSTSVEVSIIRIEDIVPATIRRNVYTLTVEDAGHYFANGVLVANCDSLRYLLHSESRQWDAGEVVPVEKASYGSPVRAIGVGPAWPGSKLVKPSGGPSWPGRK